MNYDDVMTQLYIRYLYINKYSPYDIYINIHFSTIYYYIYYFTYITYIYYVILLFLFGGVLSSHPET